MLIFSCRSEDNSGVLLFQKVIVSTYLSLIINKDGGIEEVVLHTSKAGWNWMDG